MMEDRWLVIVNPNAGIRRAEREWPAIEQCLKDEGFLFDAWLTTAPEDAIEIARKQISLGYSKIIAVGGDGTFNEVANGIMQQKRIPSHEVELAMITVGTGNDWGRMYNIPFDFKHAIQVIKRGKSFIQDACMVKYSSGIKIKQRYLVNMAGIGFDAEVALKVNKLKEKGRGGKISYFINIFSTLLQYKSRMAEVIIDQQRYPHSIFSLNVGVCQFNGGGMKQLPHAIPNSGKLALTIIKQISKLKVLANVHRLFSGSFVHMPEVQTGTATSIDITCDKNLYLEVDGESIGHTPIEFSIKAGAIRVIVNH
ncbi:MAG TPA: diacylglycerol kinase family lipid kinase [Bacteroidales bacterium]|nr:diacylglycerol kinase family lipid kinase [Bacteroidales bacterium]HRZ49684.1 diacylglycerol kinase family lipid kinase [Bacteroidales bacterium]